jgi:hypothetical protein
LIKPSSTARKSERLTKDQNQLIHPVEITEIALGVSLIGYTRIRRLRRKLNISRKKIYDFASSSSIGGVLTA